MILCQSAAKPAHKYRIGSAKAVIVKLGVSLTGIGQHPQGVDMQQSFREIVEYVRTARDLGFDFIYQGQHYLTSSYQQLQTMPLLARLSAEVHEGLGQSRFNSGA